MHSLETRKKIGEALSRKIAFTCDHCGKPSAEKPSHYARKRRHFCSNACYWAYRREAPPQEQPNYGSGHAPEERARRAKAREITNHAIRDGKLRRQPCEQCGEMAEAHHDDYTKPLAVRWLCRTHHRAEHRTKPCRVRVAVEET